MFYFNPERILEPEYFSGYFKKTNFIGQLFNYQKKP